MDDVLGQVMLTRRNEDLHTGDGITAIAIGNGFGADKAKVGSAMRLCQVHGAAPFA